MSKRIELLKEFVPHLKQLGVVVPVTPAAIITSTTWSRSPRPLVNSKFNFIQSEVHRSDQINAAITTIARQAQAALTLRTH